MANQMPTSLPASLHSTQTRSDRDTYPTSDGQGLTKDTTMTMPSGAMVAVPADTTTAMPMGATTTAMPNSTTSTMPMCNSMVMALPAKLTAQIAPLSPRADQTSDEQLLTRYVKETHDPDGGCQIDVKPLFQIVEDVLNCATQSVVHGSFPGTQMATDMMEGKGSINALVTPSDLPIILDRVSSELCKHWAGGDGHETTFSVLRLLAHFPWEAKVVLTVAAFSMTYGEFWLLAKIYPTNPLARSMALLKQLPFVVEHSGSFKCQFDAINKLIKAILNVTRCIIDFKELPTMYITEEEPKLKAARCSFLVAVYWTIRSTVGAAAHVTTLNCRGFEHLLSSNIMWELSNWEHKLNGIYEHLRGTMKILLDEAYDMLCKFIYETVHVDNMPVFNCLIGTLDDPLPLFDCANKRRVQLEVLRRKNVLLLISDLNISQDELSMFEQIYKDTKIHQPEIVWMPIIDRSIKWTETLQTQFEKLQSQMQWYSVYQPSKIDSTVIKFVQDVWNFRSKPILVVLDPQGRVVNPNASHMMWIWGSTAYPFTSAQEEALWRKESWNLKLLVDALDSKVLDWIREGKYFFVFGGGDMEWIRKFTRKVRAFAKSAGVHLEMLYVGTSHATGDDVRKVTAAIMADNLCHCWQEPTTVWLFWQRIESMLLSKIQLKQADNDADIITREIKKLLSYDSSPDGWALLSKGSDVRRLWDGPTVYSALVRNTD